MKPASYAPLYAGAMYPKLAEIAREHGYALAVHGSLSRDLDMIAVPWTEGAVEPTVLIAAIESRTAALVTGPPSEKPHGRIAYALCAGFGECGWDISFMPLRQEPTT